MQKVKTSTTSKAKRVSKTKTTSANKTKSNKGHETKSSNQSETTSKKGRKDYHDPIYVSLIHSKRWLRLRKEILETNKCLCRRCKEQGKITLATCIHHITPIQWGVTFREKAGLAYDRKNLLPLCDECHKEVHRTMGKQTLTGERAKLKAYLDDFVHRFLE